MDSALGFDGHGTIAVELQFPQPLPGPGNSLELSSSIDSTNAAL
jgi:hypothetical protein